MIVEHADRLRDLLVRLDAAVFVDDMNVPGFRLHPLKGELRGCPRYLAEAPKAGWCSKRTTISLMLKRIVWKSNG